MGLSNTRPTSTHVHPVDLLSSRILGCSVGSSNVEGRPFLGVGEILAAEDLKLPILFDNSEDGDSIVGERTPKAGRDRPCSLRRSYILWSEIT